MSTGPPAVVLGRGLTALGVTRSLARAGIPVRHLSPGPPGLLSKSRWYRPLAKDPPPEVERQPGRVQMLIEEAQLDRAVVFPCSDEAVVAMASAPSAFRERYVSHLAEGGVLERLVDKSDLAELADQADVPVPATVPIRSLDDLDELGEDWFRDALLKPVDSQRFFAHFGVKSFPVRSRAEARRAYRSFEESGTSPVLQRYVPGPPTAHVFLDGYRSRTGEVGGLLVRRRERMYPPSTGNSSCMVTIPEEQAGKAAKHLERLFDTAGFRGIFSAEFKEDAETGTPRLLEVNVRPWWYVEFTARCGVDVCSMAYREALDGPTQGSVDYDVGRRCVYVYYDWHAAWSEIRQGRLSLWGWIRSWIGSMRPVFVRDDPLPALWATWRRVRRFVRRRLVGVRRESGRELPEGADGPGRGTADPRGLDA